MIVDQFQLDIISVDQDIVTLFNLHLEKSLKDILSSRRRVQQTGRKRSELILSTFAKYRRLILVDSNVVLSPDDEFYALLLSKMQSVPVKTRVYSDTVLDVLAGILHDSSDEKIMEMTNYTGNASMNQEPIMQ